MTTTPAPRRGLFCAHFSALLQSFFARIFSKFRVFFYPTFSAVSAFFWWHFAAVSPLFCAVFCFVCKPPGKITTGSQSRKQGGTEQRSFFMSVFVAFWASVSTRKAAQAEAGAAPDPRPCSCTHFQFFPVPLLCHFCAAMATHSYPQQHTRSNEKPRYQAVFG